jgi:hypothetical protein
VNHITGNFPHLIWKSSLFIGKTEWVWLCLDRADLDTNVQSNYGHPDEAVVFSVDAYVAQSRV